MKEPRTPEPGFCAYGAAKIRERVAQLAGETEGVRAAEDIEAVHRMRVASRRIRSALPLFSCCIPGKKYRRWLRDIRAITRALGEARDRDVQVAFLESYRKARSRRKQNDAAGPDPFFGIDRLILRYREQRKKLQKPVTKALDLLEAERTLGKMEAFFRDWEKISGKTGLDGRDAFLYREASRHIRDRIADLLVFEYSLGRPDLVPEHHAMRIAAKRLRYTMELFGDIYPGRLKAPVQDLRRLQDLLGEIHDCDVWIDTLPRFLQEERAREKGKPGSESEILLIEPGIGELLANRKRERKRKFRELGVFWQDLRAAGLWDRIQEIVGRGEVPEGPAQPVSEESLGSSATRPLPLPSPDSRESGGGSA